MTLSLVLYVLAAGVANVVGAAVVTSRRRWSDAALETLIALSAGFMISVSLTELFPHAVLAGGESAALYALGGYFVVHLTQHTLATHFHFGEETHAVSMPVAMSALAGLVVHTFVDGVAIASGFAVDDRLGVLVFIAILLHKLPEGLAISSLFLAAGRSRGRALLAGAVLGAVTLLGAASASFAPALARIGLPLAAGVTLYVGASNLVPEFQSKRGWRLPGAFFAGCALFFLARAALEAVGAH